MGFWDVLNTLYDKAGEVCEKFQNSDLVNNYKTQMYNNVQDKANEVLSNPSAYSSEQLERAKEYRATAKEEARALREEREEIKRAKFLAEQEEAEAEEEYDKEDDYDCEEETPELGSECRKQDKTYNKAAFERESSAQSSNHRNIMEEYLSGVMPVSHADDFEEFAEDMSDEQKAVLDKLGIHYGYYFEHSLIREFFKAMDNPIANRCFFSNAYSKDENGFFQCIGEWTQTVYSRYRDYLFNVFSIDESYMNRVVNAVAQFYPTPDDDNNHYVPFIFFAADGIYNFENGFIVFVVYDDNNNVNDIMLYVRNNEDDWWGLSFGYIFNVESTLDTVIINNCIKIDLSHLRAVKSENRISSMTLKDILNVFILVYWSVMVDDYVFSKIRFLDNFADDIQVKLALRSTLLIENRFLEFLRETQSDYAFNTPMQCERQQAEVEGGWKCQCGADNLATSMFCPNCGAKKTEEKQSWVCQNCNAENAPNAKFCNQCGKPKL